LFSSIELILGTCSIVGDRKRMKIQFCFIIIIIIIICLLINYNLADSPTITFIPKASSIMALEREWLLLIKFHKEAWIFIALILWNRLVLVGLGSSYSARLAFLSPNPKSVWKTNGLKINLFLSFRKISYSFNKSQIILYRLLFYLCMFNTFITFKKKKDK